MGRPKTRDVVRSEVQAMVPELAQAIAQALGLVGNTPTQAPVAARMQAPAGMPSIGTRPEQAARVERATERTEKMPEGGYADTFECVSALAQGEPRPTLKSGRRIPDDILGQNVNVYFWRTGDGQSVKPVQQARAQLLAAGFRFTDKHGEPRWFGADSKLPAYFAQGRVTKRSR